METIHSCFLLFISTVVCLISCTFVNVPREPNLGAAWAYNYDPHKGILAMRNNYRASPNDTCHVYKLTDQQRHDIHTIAGEFNIEIMMYDAIITKHGETMTVQELNQTSYNLWKFCKNNLHFMKYNFYV
ncbi:uncharacterized protein LOC134271436 [Saccostrea cucullata]|uniref:uncharacterized protein LOC134271436 n=1 Tax=Saccostrea cuccullata TaxID=36930 RepID=UPI002ED5FF8E